FAQHLLFSSCVRVLFVSLLSIQFFYFFFFFQAEDGIRDFHVTGVQTCALPILLLRCHLRGFSAGAKVQVLLPTDDVRTYTPIRAPEGMVLLGWKHAGGPGARWLASAREGDELPFVGPQRSLDLAPGQAVLIGDETSVGVAAALSADRPGQVHAVIQSDRPSDVRAAAAAVGLADVDVVPR